VPKTVLTKIAPYKENPARRALSRSKGVIRAKRKAPASGDQRHNDPCPRGWRVLTVEGGFSEGWLSKV